MGPCPPRQYSSVFAQQLRGGLAGTLAAPLRHADGRRPRALPLVFKPSAPFYIIKQSLSYSVCACLEISLSVGWRARARWMTGADREEGARRGRGVRREPGPGARADTIHPFKNWQPGHKGPLDALSPSRRQSVVNHIISGVGERKGKLRHNGRVFIFPKSSPRQETAAKDTSRERPGEGSAV